MREWTTDATSWTFKNKGKAQSAKPMEDVAVSTTEAGGLLGLRKHPLIVKGVRRGKFCAQAKLFSRAPRDKDGNPVNMLEGKAADLGLDADEDPGSVEGFAAVYDVTDLEREIFRKGAFAKSVMEGVPTGNVPLMSRHFAFGGDVSEVIGSVLSMEELDFGLFFKAEFSPDGMSQALRAKVVAKHIKTTSIGFVPVEWKFIEVDNHTLVEHLESKAVEVTLTVKPVNPLAVITGAKSGDGMPLTSMVEITIQELDQLDVPDDITEPQAKALIEEHFQTQENADAVAKALSALHNKISGLLLPKSPQSTGGADDTELDHSAVVTSKAALHDMGAEIRERRLRMMKLGLKV